MMYGGIQSGLQQQQHQHQQQPHHHHHHQQNFIPSGKLLALPRRRLNSSAIYLSIGVPWILFGTCAFLLSFEIHYYHAEQCYFLVGCCGIVVAFLASKAAFLARNRTMEAKRQSYDAGEQDPTLYYFVAVTALAAWLLGIALGSYNYPNTEAYLSQANLNTASDVDPSALPAKAYMDAGIVLFKNGSFVDQSKSLGYKDSTTYCIAPITRGTTALTSYSFWAVGKDCCNPFGGEFWCGEAGNPIANAGLRLMDNEERANYRIAAQMAGAEYKILTSDPIFFHWAEDPSTSAGKKGAHSPASYRERARNFFLKVLLGHFIFQAIASYLVVNQYAKLNMPI